MVELRVSLSVCTKFSYKFSIFLSDFKQLWIFSTDFFFKFSNVNFQENPPSARELILADRQDVAKLTGAFHMYVHEMNWKGCGRK